MFTSECTLSKIALSLAVKPLKIVFMLQGRGGSFQKNVNIWQNCREIYILLIDTTQEPPLQWFG